MAVYELKEEFALAPRWLYVLIPLCSIYLFI